LHEIRATGEEIGFPAASLDHRAGGVNWKRGDRATSSPSLP
jgi:hypothetical protein